MLKKIILYLMIQKKIQIDNNELNDASITLSDDDK